MFPIVTLSLRFFMHEIFLCNIPQIAGCHLVDNNSWMFMYLLVGFALCYLRFLLNYLCQICRNEQHGNSSTVCSVFGKTGDLEASSQQGTASLYPEKDNCNGLANQGCVSCTEMNEDVSGPDTPGMHRVVPRLKRILEDNLNIGDKKNSSLLDSSKRMRLLQDSVAGVKNCEEEADTTSKFEWLDPSKIRDANRRRPDDPLYDKRTLYIPPEALKKMSASQKQYWNVKSQYMDVLLFFKVVSYCAMFKCSFNYLHFLQGIVSEHCWLSMNICLIL